jgi:mannose-6-phosphate isomerase-like protein (cupin superfamily)
MAQLAAAAVLALLLVGSLLLVRQITFERPQTQMAAVGEPTVETLTDATLTGAAESWTPLAVERWRFLPGDATLTIPPIDGPQWIVADGGSVVATVGGNAQVLAPGKSLVIPAGQELQVRNSGLTETAIYRGVAATGFSLEEYDRDMIAQEVALDTEAHEALPPGNSHIIFDRLTIPAGTTLQADTATGQDWFDIVTGGLGLTLTGDVLPQGWTTGRERELTVDDPIPVLVPGTHITMRNIGNDPLVLLRLRVQPEGNADGSGGATATP